MDDPALPGEIITAIGTLVGVPRPVADSRAKQAETSSALSIGALVSVAVGAALGAIFLLAVFILLLRCWKQKTVRHSNLITQRLPPKKSRSPNQPTFETPEDVGKPKPFDSDTGSPKFELQASTDRILGESALPRRQEENEMAVLAT